MTKIVIFFYLFTKCGIYVVVKYLCILLLSTPRLNNAVKRKLIQVHQVCGKEIGVQIEFIADGLEFFIRFGRYYECVCVFRIDSVWFACKKFFWRNKRKIYIIYIIYTNIHTRNNFISDRLALSFPFLLILGLDNNFNLNQHND